MICRKGGPHAGIVAFERPCCIFHHTGVYMPFTGTQPKPFREGSMYKNDGRSGIFRPTPSGWFAICAAMLISLTAAGASAQTFLSDAELLATIPGMTVYSKTDRGTPWAQNYSMSDVDDAKKGSIRGIFGKRKYYAKWFVRDGKWCENWGNGQACWTVERVNSKTLRMYGGGKPRPNLWNLKPIEAPKS